MRIETDKLTNILGIIGAVLIIQQTYLPELIPKEYASPVLASIVSTFGLASNKRKITIWFNGTNNQIKTISELEDEMEKKWQEMEELIEKARRICEVCKARNRGNKNEQQ